MMIFTYDTGSSVNFRTIKDLFEMARSVEKTAIVFIDEIDSVCRKRNDSEADYSRRQVSEKCLELNSDMH